jgi:hypothetical protein
MTRPRNELDEFLGAVGGLQLPSERLDELLAGAVRAVHAQLDAPLAAEVIEGCSRIRDLHERYVRANANFSVLKHAVSGGPGPLDYWARLRSEVSRLRSYVPLLMGRPRPGGVSARELREEADIGKSLWGAILKASGIRLTGRGDHGRTFSNREIRQLIAAAASWNTKKSREAAACWDRLIEELTP